MNLESEQIQVVSHVLRCHMHGGNLVLIKTCLALIHIYSPFHKLS